jgi:hypothetical protein
MRKTILTILGASVIAALAAQTASASENRPTRKSGSAPASEPFRNSNAYAAPAYAARGGTAAPAGR